MTFVNALGTGVFAIKVQFERDMDSLTNGNERNRLGAAKKKTRQKRRKKIAIVI